MSGEKQYILEAFEKNFGRLRRKRLAIYGLGPHTRHILERFPDFNIVGLLDELRAGDVVYGQPVLFNEQLAALGVEAVVIVAQMKNVGLIYRRIARICREQAIAVYDLNGKNLGEAARATKNFDQYNSISFEALREKIIAADVVSFDVFDTLVMRRTLYPRDVFRLVGEKIGDADSVDGRFAPARVEAELELYGQGLNPTIHSIYERLQKRLKLSAAAKNRWQELEMETEAEVLIRRERMCEALDFAFERGKTVFFVSDMYLPADLLGALLNKLGLATPPERLLVSCDYGRSKSGGLFEILRGRAGGGRILHIGDDCEADGRAARRYGLDDVFPIKSALAMLEDSYGQALLNYGQSLPNRLLIGEFAACQLNDPFLFSETGGKFRLSGHYEMARAYLAPIIFCFFGWMMEKARELGLERILLSARDGWIMEKMARLFEGEAPDLPPTQYFYASRVAAVLAGLRTDQDILEAGRFAYAGTMEEMLTARFGLPAEDISARGEESDDEAYLLAHRDKILRRAEAARRNYRKYLATLPIAPGARVGFFDFVAAGTCQKALARFADFDLYGLYCALIHSDRHERAGEIAAMFETENMYEKSRHLFENYFFLENILTSPEPSLKEFDEEGRPVFLPERRTPRQLERLEDIHQAILDYAARSWLGPARAGQVDKALSDLIFGLLNRERCLFNDDYFETELLADDFCNRAPEPLGFG